MALLFRPERSFDFVRVLGWSRAWLGGFGGAQVSGTEAWFSDYPPHAIVFFAPLSVLPRAASIILWAAFNVALAVMAPALAARAVNPRADRRSVLLLTLLFLCWSGSRTLMQSSLLTLVLGLSAQALVNDRPGWSGACLGLALMKPQVAAPFALWMLLAGRWRVLANALATVAAGWIVYIAVGHVRLQDVVVQYATVLRHYYSGAEPMRGVADLRPVFLRFVDPAASDLVSLLAAFVLLALVVVDARLTLASPGPRDAAGRVAWGLAFVPALAGAWSLLTFYHLTYGFVLLLPASALLLLVDDPSSARARRLVFWIMQLGLIFDVPTIWRRIGGALPEGLDAAVGDFDRWFVLAVFLSLLLVHRMVRHGQLRLQASPAAARGAS